MSLSPVYNCAIATRLSLADADADARSRAKSNDVLATEDSWTTHPPHDHPPSLSSVLLVLLVTRYTVRYTSYGVRMPMIGI